jgi:hypothetical protein
MNDHRLRQFRGDPWYRAFVAPQLSALLLGEVLPMPPGWMILTRRRRMSSPQWPTK